MPALCMTSFSTHTLAQRVSVGKNLKFVERYFTKPSYQTFRGIIKSFIKNQDNGKLSILSTDVGKCISSIGYFFTDAKWDSYKIKQATQEHLLKSKRTKIQDGDIASLDGSSVSKKGNAFEFIGEVWDNADKRVHTGYELFALAIVSPAKQTRWIFDWLLYSNQHPQCKTQPLYILRLLKRLFRTAKKIQTIVMDHGFKNKYTLNFVLTEGKNFIIRADKDMKLWGQGYVNKRGHSYGFGDIRNMPNAKHYDLTINGRRGWSVTWTRGIVNAWMSEIKTPLTVVVVKNPCFRNPLILVTNLDPTDFPETFQIYETYLLRWKIEQIFQSIKELGLEQFRVRKFKAIIRYITIVFIVHSLLTWQTAYFRSKVHLKKIFETLLKKKRKIRSLMIGGMKIFYELYLTKSITLKELCEQTQ